MQSALVHFIHPLLDFVYPNTCIICNSDLVRTEQFICSACNYDLPYITPNHDEVTKLNKLFSGRVPVEQVISLLKYEKGNQIQQLLHAIKYHHKTKLAFHFGTLLGEEIKKQELKFDFIIPVPLHPKKERKRGFNQSYEIARGIFDRTAITINTKNLIRKISNDSQTGFSKYDRYDNVRSIFHLNNPIAFQNKSLLLIDDVLTTGATIESCVAELIHRCNCKVSVATLAARI